MIKYSGWHKLLDMPIHDKKWHLNDISDEMTELQEASKLIDRWSEYSDVVYTITRGRWSGHQISSPISKAEFIYGSIYMFPKYSLRWLFFRYAGKRTGAKYKITEVRNPQKTHKLITIANKYEIDPDLFTTQCAKQLKYWPLLK